ncbi:hypothetical protein [Comamonas sp. NoAH]|uniref:hypothetical protein n=1 Tax=Comamonas halotolerans TaxID=3041496 RepID=UPI0024E08C26|nr:hypothetical protein [Comamonas sp. NoAH]
MISEVIVQLSADQQFRTNVDRLPPMGNEEARRWLDSQFTELECEPLRPSGKVLLADKVLVVAREAGARRLGDEMWFQTYARATHAVLGRPVIKVDVSAMTVTY